MNGILNLHKPVGPTSFDMVRRVKQLTGVKRVGHGGTLDPRASGVLPVLLGQATRVSDFLLSASKAYRAVVLLGIATDTYDSEGKIVSEADPSGVTREQAIAALARLRGLLPQTPPMDRAATHRGRPLDQLARAGAAGEPAGGGGRAGGSRRRRSCQGDGDRSCVRTSNHTLGPG